MVSAPGEVRIIMNSTSSWEQTWLRKVKALSRGHTAAAEPGSHPEGPSARAPGWKEDGVGKARVAASDEAGEMGQVLSLIHI